MRLFWLSSVAVLSLSIFAGCQNKCPSWECACPECECPAAETACSVPAADTANAEAPAAEEAKAEEVKAEDNGALIEAGAEEIVLPKPVPTDVTLTKALQDRRSVRAYTEQNLKLQDVSNLLWSANGINREDGKRTAPSARNLQSVTIYAAFEKGTYKYDHKDHKLVRVTEEDLRPIKQAPMELIFTSNLKNDKPDADQIFDATMRGIDSGTASQNAALYCAAAGLGTVIRMFHNEDEKAVLKPLNLPENELPLFNMAIGYEQKN